MEDKTPEEIYEEFWRPILEKDGKLDMDQLKKELSDFLMIMEMVPEVYCEVTGGRVSNPLVIPQQVIGAHQDYMEEMEEETKKGILEECAEEYMRDNSSIECSFDEYKEIIGKRILEERIVKMKAPRKIKNATTMEEDFINALIDN